MLDEVEINRFSDSKRFLTAGVGTQVLKKPLPDGSLGRAPLVLMGFGSSSRSSPHSDWESPTGHRLSLFFFLPESCSPMGTELQMYTVTKVRPSTAIAPGLIEHDE